MKTLMTIVSIMSGLVMGVTLIMINCFGLVALYNTMSAATLIFITSMAYMTGYDHASKEKKEVDYTKIDETI